MNQKDILSELKKYIKNIDKEWNYVTSPDARKIGLDKFFLLDIRHPNDYKQGHIKNTTNIFWKKILEDKNLKKLPKNKKILIICYVGHTASQVLVLLKLLGYDAKVLKFGMGKSPKADVPVAGWLNYDYPITK